MPARSAESREISHTLVLMDLRCDDEAATAKLDMTSSEGRRTELGFVCGGDAGFSLDLSAPGIEHFTNEHGQAKVYAAILGIVMQFWAGHKADLPQHHPAEIPVMTVRSAWLR